jgi:hypothetical protein
MKKSLIFIMSLIMANTEIQWDDFVLLNEANGSKY